MNLLRSVAPWLLLAVAACDGPPPPASSYYDENIAPTLAIGCAAQTAPCHLATPEGTAAGNLDLTTYDSFMRRADVLPAYGPYPVGLLLLKGGPSVDVTVETFDPPDPTRPDERFVVVHTDVRHAAGAGVKLDGRAYSRLRQWIDAGHTRTGIAPATTGPVGTGPCRHGPGTLAGFDPAAPPADPASFDDFVANVQPGLVARCAYSSCHGSALADLYLSCGESDEEKRWNWYISVQHLDAPSSTSELLRRPLAPLHGGVFHEGGTIYEDTSDPLYVATRDWADRTVTESPALIGAGDASPGLRFFANRVQPVLVRKGCMFLNCHSGAMFHDLRFRTGSQGVFSRVATRINYSISRMMLAPESVDPSASRIIGKNLFPPDILPDGRGIRHRGGSLFEDFGHAATPADCAGFDADHGDLNVVPAYCVLARWHAIERDAAIAAGDVRPDASPLAGVVWIARPPDTGTPLDFDTFRPGADLMWADATMAADGSVTLGAPRSLLGGCTGLSAASSDVRNPAVSWDGSRIAFAARSAASEPLALWWMSADGSACERVPDVGAHPASDAATGIPLHDFDPAFAPDGRLVFASTRGALDCVDFSSCGPTRTPASMAPNANLYVYEPLQPTKVRQLTFGLNEEVSPGFLVDGRVLMTAEKREQDFHQLAIRRENLDGGDYHPEFAQRPSMGYQAGLEPVDLPTRNLAFVAAQLASTRGAGTIAILNRTIGPSQPDRDPTDRFFIESVRTPFTTGVFRSPASLPGMHLLASCDLAATDATSTALDFDLCDLDPQTGTAVRIGGAAGVADVEIVAVYGHGQHGVFLSRPDEANGHTAVDPTARDAIVRVHDFPMIETLLFSNTRVGRPIDDGIAGFDVLVDLPPPASARTLDDVAADVVTDTFGRFYSHTHTVGHVPLFPDGAAYLRFRGGEPIRLMATDASGAPREFAAGAAFTGPRLQRETMQFYPGERSNQSFKRSLFNGLCAGCHGSISGRELDQSVNVDVLTSASRDDSVGTDPVDLYGH